VFDNCIIHSKKNSYITAASTPKGVKFGYVFIDCKLTFAKGIDKVYLGRPWRAYAKTVFLNCDLGDFIRPEGWKEWSGRYKNVYYAEYKCTGKSAGKSGRVSWSHELTEEEASKYTIGNIFSGGREQTLKEKSWYKKY